MGLSVTEQKLCLGCMSFGSSRWRSWVLDEAESLPILDAAIESGVTVLDTANVYSGGESERIVGRFIHTRGLRDKVFIATKLFYDTPGRLGKTGLGSENIIASAEACLARLGIDSIDLLQIHRWDPNVAIEETLQAFATLIKSGKVKAVGASNLMAWQLAKAQLAAQRMGVPGFSAVQPHYNLLYREDERDLIPFCQDQGLVLLPWSPLARGRLARQPQGEVSERARQDDVADSLYGGTGGSVIAALHDLARDTGDAPASLALAWLIAKGTSPIFGATAIRHVHQAARAAKITLTDAQIKRLEQPYRALPHVILPYSAKNQATTASLPINGAS